MMRKLERFKQNPLRILVTKRIFDEVTGPQPKACEKNELYHRSFMVLGTPASSNQSKVYRVTEDILLFFSPVVSRMFN